MSQKIFLTLAISLVFALGFSTAVTSSPPSVEKKATSELVQKSEEAASSTAQALR